MKNIYRNVLIVILFLLLFSFLYFLYENNNSYNEKPSGSTLVMFN